MADKIESKIKKEWIAKAMGEVNFSLEEKIDDAVLNEEAVILVQGINLFGDAIYSYVKVALRNFRALREAMISGQNFKPSDYGQVVAAGRGEPTEEVREEMRIAYNMVDITQRVKAKAEAQLKAKRAMPTFFGDTAEEESN